MNSKKKNQSKKSKTGRYKKSNVNQNDAEVFVLPPNLLEKLGIHLGVAPECPTNIKKDKEIETVHYNQGSTQDENSMQNVPPPTIENNSSFLETATLMKKSVFLSPTFQPTAVNVAPEQVQLTEFEDLNDIQYDDTKKNSTIPCDAKVDVDKSKLIINREYEENPIDNNSIQSSITLDYGYAAENYHENVNLQTECNKIADDFIDEAYSTDNSNMGSSNSDSLPLVKPKQKINIISEEVNPKLSEMQNLKNLFNPNRNCFVPITMDTVITKNIHEINNISNKNLSSYVEKVDMVLNIQSEVKEVSEPNVLSLKILSPLINTYTTGESSTIFQDTDKNVLMSQIEQIKSIEQENDSESKTSDIEDNSNIIKHDLDKEKENEGISENSITYEADNVHNENKINFGNELNVSKNEMFVKNIKDDVTIEVNDVENGVEINEPVLTASKNTKTSQTSLYSVTNIQLHSVTECISNRQLVITESVKDSDDVDIQTNNDFNVSIISSDTASHSMADLTLKNTTTPNLCSEKSECISIEEKQNKDCNLNVCQDKVKEIAEYLKQISQNSGPKKRNIRKVSTIKREGLNSKLCIQGVEKPGGWDDYHIKFNSVKLLKTYERLQSNKKMIVCDYDINSSVSVNSDENVEIDCIVNEETQTRNEEFCICNDFGKLQNYDTKECYEHLHFWLHRNLKCEVDTLFDIYKDHEDNIDSHMEVITYSVNADSNTESDDYICWNFSKCKENKSAIVKGDIEENKQHSDNIVHQDKEYEIFYTHKESNVYSPNINDNLVEEVHNTHDNVTNIDTGNIIGESRCLESNVEVYQEIYECLNDLPVHLEQSNNDKAEETITSETGIMDVNVMPNECTPANTKGQMLEIEISRDNKTTVRKRNNTTDDGPATKKNIKCNVCEQMLNDTEWENHISEQHCYVAWKDGETFEIEDVHLQKKLKGKLRTDGLLKCTFCNKEYKSLKKFLSHVQKCLNLLSTEGGKLESSNYEEKVKCGVCKQNVKIDFWFEHITQAHQYLAWKEGEQPLDLHDENAVKEHLYSVTQTHSKLICSKCGLLRNKSASGVKSYLAHIKTCGLNVPQETPTNDSNDSDNVDDVPLSNMSSFITCAVCEVNVKSSAWFEHASQKHDYLAWKVGEAPLDLEDEESIKQYLLDVSKQAGGLVCRKCGLTRKYPKAYLQHMKTCQVEDTQVFDFTGDAESSISIDQKVPKCAVCHAVVVETAWMDHIQQEHNYMAWKESETPVDLNDVDSVRRHLFNIVSEIGKLTCAKCGKGRKYPKKFMEHIKFCNGLSLADESRVSLDCSIKSEVNETLELNTSDVTEVECGVCQEKLLSNKWISHIQNVHNYVAWKSDEPPLDINDEYTMSDYFRTLVKTIGCVVCNRCDVKFKYVKPYLQHVKNCKFEKDTNDEPKQKAPINRCSGDNSGDIVVCGVCNDKMRVDRWMSHIQTAHEYVAWKMGQIPINIDDSEDVHSHLQSLVNKTEGLICCKCGLLHKDVQLFIDHVKCCNDNSEYDPLASMEEIFRLEFEGLYKCAMCSESVMFDNWKKHAMDKHYNVTWVVGDEPVDLKSSYGAAKNLKEYHNYAGKFHCKTCGITRVSGMGFYAHIIVCGKTDEEKEMFQNVCEICNNKYICIYKSQHMTMHAQKELTKELKIKAEIDREKEIERKAELSIVSGRRRAAQKAQSVIENYNKAIKAAQYVCSTCGFATDLDAEMKQHVCPKRKRRISDDELSLESAVSSEDDGLDSDENASAEEDDNENKRKRRDGTKINKYPKLPFTVTNNKKFLVKSYKDFCDTYLTTDTLFPQWSHCKHSHVPEENIPKYMPHLEESCKLYKNDEWLTLKRFESRRKGSLIFFVGASIQCISWVPPKISKSNEISRFIDDDDDDYSMASGEKNYLAVVAHVDSDCPRYTADEIVEHPALIQIWEFGDFNDSLPRLALGIAHDYGTVWAMDWCPSGVRECVPTVQQFTRMGLLSVACSNGHAYIFSVPYPSTITDSDTIFYKLKPVVKLKFSMNSDRKSYQASSICWSKQKGHAVVIVGYADGSTAFYDLNTESPFLKAEEDGITVIYPYYDERSLKTCITGLSMYPSCGGGGVGVLGVASGVGGGVAARAGRAQALARAESHAPVARVCFAPGWPGLITSGDDAIMNLSTNELDFTGYGRRVGLVRSCCGCERCGLTATYTVPYLRVMRTHPVYADIKRRVVGLIKMRALGRKRKLINDELGIKAEPLTYQEVVTKYGVEFNTSIKNSQAYAGNKASHLQKEIFPDRFPLADVPSMAFCPTPAYHSQLSIATHAGFIFVVKV